MKKLLWIFLIMLSGCRAHWVYTPAPADPLSMQTAVIASGVWEAQDFYFTLISHYEQDKKQARVIVLAEPALKLLDCTVSKEQIQVHQRAPQVPNGLIRAWGQLIRAQFLTPCPVRNIVQKTADPKGTFKVAVTGGICL